MNDLKFTTAGNYMKKTNSFRSWLNDKWLEHKSEVYAFTGKPCNYELGEYFNKYKWWLRRIYKEEIKNGNY